MIDRAAVVFAKLPRAGRVKTRLVPFLSAEQAAELFRAFLLDTIALVDRAHSMVPGGFERVLAVAIEPGDALEALAPAPWRCVAQSAGDLGARMAHAIASAGAERVVILGSDSPTLPPEHVAAAFAALEEEGRVAAVGPTADGGYYAIAARGAVPELFADIPWSTPEVMARTRARAGAAGIRLVELPPHYDVDDPADLERARADARRPGSLAIHTRAALDALLA